MLKEFRDFIARGNVMELAVGIIIGASFTAIVNSLVQDLINPLVGIFTGGIDFSNLFFALSTERYTSVAAAEAAGVAVFRYGSFVTAVINFLIIAWVVFLLVKGVNKMKEAAVRDRAAAPEAPPSTPAGPTQEELLAEIRDLLKSQPR
ncbi:large conductance mechanosensitive channel protein MscL [Plastorhodobacter daqingensis]|uniref:Large-conductance mechanosensitive channel n=1 Tax=Plastorhodobacter daqingensis TaxID=1387281 RepID=A0ABW2UI15_9RHOB